MKQYKDTDYYISENGKVFRNGRQISTRSDKDGYRMLNMYINKKKKTKLLHRVIGETYIPNPYDLPQINHKNGIKDDNRISNLEWTTPKRNTQHAIENNLRNTQGENNSQSKLTEEQVKEIRKKYVRNKYGYKKLADEYNVSDAQIMRIVKYRCWKHI